MLGYLNFIICFYIFSWAFLFSRRRCEEQNLGVCSPLQPAYVVYETFAFLSQTAYLFLVFLRAFPHPTSIHFHVVDVIEKKAKGVRNNRRGFRAQGPEKSQPHFKLAISLPHKQSFCQSRSLRFGSHTQGNFAYYEMWMGNFRFIRFQFKRGRKNGRRN